MRKEFKTALEGETVLKIFKTKEAQMNWQRSLCTSRSYLHEDQKAQIAIHRFTEEGKLFVEISPAKEEEELLVRTPEGLKPFYQWKESLSEEEKQIKHVTEAMRKDGLSEKYIKNYWKENTKQKAEQDLELIQESIPKRKVSLWELGEGE